VCHFEKPVNKLTNFTTKKIFTRLLTNKSAKNYWNYISELRKRKTEEIYKKSTLLTKSDSLKERVLGVNILAQFGLPRLHKKEIINILFELLETETDKEIISSILYGISHNNEKLNLKQIKFLCSFTTHKSIIVRHSLAFALCTIDKEIAIDSLIELSNDKDEEVRDWATFGLGSQLETDTDKIRTALWNRILDKDEGARFEAISGLAQRKDKRIKEILKKELENIDEYGSLILESIEYLNDKSLIPNIEKQIKLNKISKKINEDWLLNTLNKLKK